MSEPTEMSDTSSTISEINEPAYVSNPDGGGPLVPEGFCLDIYQYPVRCDPNPVDPCSGDRATTLYNVAVCTERNPTLEVWCAQYPTHPQCALVFGVGDPPVSRLPDTGGSMAGGSIGMLIAVIGMLIVRIARRAT